jgi:hypothetical protein
MKMLAYSQTFIAAAVVATVMKLLMAIKWAMEEVGFKANQHKLKMLHCGHANQYLPPSSV